MTAMLAKGDQIAVGWLALQPHTHRVNIREDR